MNKRIILLVLFALSMSGCKKWQHQYPEDENRTKLTPKERLLNKTWVLQYATLNGIDYTDSVNNLFGAFKMVFKDDDYGILRKRGQLFIDKYPNNLNIIWDFENMDQLFYLSKELGVNYGKYSAVPFFLPPDDEGFNFETFWTILKLDVSEFKIQIQTLDKDSVVINNYKAM